MPTAALKFEGKTPYEAMHGRKPDLSRAHRWYGRVYAQTAAERGTKLGPRAKEGRWVGPSSETDDGHKIYWPGTGRVTVERNVRFLDESAIEGESEPVGKASDTLRDDSSHSSSIHPCFTPY